MKLLPLVVVLLAAAPAGAQSRLYTNADVGRPLSPDRRTVTSAELDGLRARQFVYVPPARPADPGISVLASSSTEGPFGAFAPFAVPVRLDGTPYTDPPWQMSTYRGWSGAGRGRSGGAPSPHARAGRR